MSYDVGNFVSFFDHDDTFENINLNLVENYIDDVSWYEIVSINNPNDDFITVRSLSQGEDIIILKNEYQIHTKQSLRKHLTDLLVVNEANKKYADVCKKIRQLYRKQEFKFQGVYS
jgi:hypothetical protein